MTPNIKYICPNVEIFEFLMELARKNLTNYLPFDGGFHKNTPPSYGNDYDLFVIFNNRFGVAGRNSECDRVGKLFTFEEMVKAIMTPEFKPIEIKLNSEHIAVIHRDKVVVGCQTFEFGAIEKLAEGIKKVKNQ